MYGIINKAIEKHVIETYGVMIWQKVSQTIGIHKKVLFCDNTYHEELCYSIAQTTSLITHQEVSQVIQRFGHYFITKTSREEMGILLMDGGSSFKQLLLNIPKLEQKLALVYPRIHFNKLEISSINSQQYKISYYQDRKEAVSLLTGILNGMASLFSNQIQIQILLTEEDHTEMIIIIDK